MKTVKKRIFAGAVCEQVVYNCGDNTNVKKSKPRPRFKNDQEREEHRNGIKLRRFTRKVNANFTPNGYWCTLTFSEENECHEFADAAIARRNLARRLKYFDKTCKIIIVMGRGHSTSRIHFHMFVEGERINAETVAAAWELGEVIKIDHLRAHNRVNGIDVGADFSAVALYCFKHWTEEQGGRVAYFSRNLVDAEEEAPKECHRDYSESHPPVCPKGYFLVSVTWNRFGYLIFKYVKKPTRGRLRSSCV